MTLQTAFPHARFVFPTAARRRATIYKRALTHQWFDSWKLDPPATEREELQIEGLRETTLYLHQLLRSEIAVVSGGAKNVVLGGLSQGCAASLVALLLWEGENLGAVVGMCGWLPFTKSLMTEVQGGEENDGADELGFNPFAVDACDTDDLDHKTADTPAQKAMGWLREQLDLPALKVSSDTLPVHSIPIFLGHGAQDEKVSIQLGRTAAECLDKLGAGVCWKEYEDLGHWYSPEMLKDLLHFLLETFGDPQSLKNESSHQDYIQ
jgi:predicted esterase